MAAATAITTFPHLFKGISAPFLRHYHRRRCLSLTTTTTTTTGVINNHNNNFPHPYPLAIFPHNNITLSSSSRKSRSQLLPPSRRHLHMSPGNVQMCVGRTNGKYANSCRTEGVLCYCKNSTDAQISTTTTEITPPPSDEDEKMAMIRDAGNSLDIRVGRIVKIWRHEEADSLYVEEVDVGEPEPRTICSGLVKYIPIDLLQDKNVIVLANLKPRNMRGVKSSGMLMAASDVSHENVELLVPPEGAVPGERVWFGSIDDKENLPEVASPNQVQKKKIWELVQPHLRTDESCVAALGALHHMRTSAGVITSPSLKDANIS